MTLDIGRGPVKHSPCWHCGEPELHRADCQINLPPLPPALRQLLAAFGGIAFGDFSTSPTLVQLAARGAAEAREEGRAQALAEYLRVRSGDGSETPGS